MKNNAKTQARLEKVRADMAKAAATAATLVKKEAELQNQIETARLQAERRANATIGSWLRNQVGGYTDFACVIQQQVDKETRPKIRLALGTLFKITADTRQGTSTTQAPSKTQKPLGITTAPAEAASQPPIQEPPTAPEATAATGENNAGQTSLFPEVVPPTPPCNAPNRSPPQMPGQCAL